MPKIVKYKGKYYIWYKTNESGKAQLIDEYGHKFPGTPTAEKLVEVRVLMCKQFNGHEYFMTKIGCFSATTGNKVIQPEIINLFK